MRTRQWTKLNEKLHSPPDDSPSHIVYDDRGRVTDLNWHEQGKEHRESGPSSIVIDPDTGIHTYEGFRTRGEPRDPAIGPSDIWRSHTQNGKIWHLRYAGDDSPINGNVQSGEMPVPDSLEP